jgi:hypothetical protein
VNRLKSGKVSKKHGRLVTAKKWLTTPFQKSIRFRSLFGYWFAIMAFAIFLRMAILAIYPPSGELEEQFLSNFCDPWTLAIVVLAPLTENMIFMIIPFILKGPKALAIGLGVWALFHYIDRDLPSLFQTLALCVFYFKAVSAKKYKESVFFHGIINWLAAVGCA